jgi:hypothetical protein
MSPSERDRGSDYERGQDGHCSGTGMSRAGVPHLVLVFGRGMCGGRRRWVGGRTNWVFGNKVSKKYFCSEDKEKETSACRCPGWMHTPRSLLHLCRNWADDFGETLAPSEYEVYQAERERERVKNGKAAKGRRARGRRDGARGAPEEPGQGMRVGRELSDGGQRPWRPTPRRARDVADGLGPMTTPEII